MKTQFKKILKENTQHNFTTDADEINAWFKDFPNIKYKIAKDGEVIIDGNFLIDGNNVEEIPFKIKSIDGDVDVSGNKLTTLAWSPEYIDRGFHCYDNLLTTLEGGPKKVGGSFDAENNKLTNLHGSPISTGGAFIVTDNPLTSFAGCPKTVGSYFKANECKQIVKVDYLPENIGTNLYLARCGIKSAKGLNKLTKGINIKNLVNEDAAVILDDQLESGLISLMMIKGLTYIDIDIRKQRSTTNAASTELEKAVKIINKAISDGIDALDAQDLLIDAGLGRFS